MGLITKSVKIIPKNSTTISYYRKLGYEITLGEEIEVPIGDVPKGSKIKVDCTCDYCGIGYLMQYSEYNKVMSSDLPKLSCKNCYVIKRRESNLLKYGVINPTQLDSVKEKTKETCLKKYGKENYTQTCEFRERAEKTCLEKYGVKNPSQNKEIHQKVINTNIERYGGSSPTKSQEVIEKTRQTNLNRYGVVSPTVLPEVKQKLKNTMLERYGVENASQSEEILKRKKDNSVKKYGVENYQGLPSFLEKKRQTNIERYGFANCAQSPEVQKKMASTMSKNQTVKTSKQQLYIHNLYGGELNGVVSYYNCDIVFRDEKLICEVDLGGHDLCVKIGAMAEKEFRRKEYVRDRNIKSEGFRIIRIISRKDYLPSDEILLSMLQYARDFFTQNPERSWVSFDIDSSCIYNAYHKESEGGIPYDFGSLRKIKKSDLRNNSTNTTTTPSTTLSSPTLPLNPITA